MLPHISEDLSSSFIEKLEGMLQKYRGETVNFDSRKVRKFKGFKFPRPDNQSKEVMVMMYPYMELADGTEIVHSHLIEDNGKKR